MGRRRHGGVLRRARARGGRARRRRREGRGAASAARCRSSRRTSPSCSSATASALTFTLDVNDVVGCEFLFVCVDTPPTHSGDADLSRVWTVVDELPELTGRPILVMKSTVPVGTGEKVRAGLDQRGLSTSATRRTRSSSPRGPPSRTSCTPTASSIGAFEADDADAVAALYDEDRRADRALRRQLGRDDQARRERRADDAHLVHQRDRERVRGDGRGRRQGRGGRSGSTSASARSSCAQASATAARASRRTRLR